MKKILRYAVLLLALIILAGGLINESQYEYGQRSFFAMDTFINISIEAKNVQNKLDELEALINKLDAELSRTDEESLIFKLNHAKRAWAQLGDDAVELIDEAKKLRDFTEGAFDISIAPLMDLWGFTGDEYRVPEEAEIEEAFSKTGMEHIHLNGNIVSLDEGSRLDFGGIAKGYVLEKAEEFFEEEHVKRAVLFMGGDIIAYGSKSGGTPWKIAVEDPASPDNALSFSGLLNVKNSYVMTSGNYQRYFIQNGIRYHHILDPSTGRPAQSGLSSVTVVADAKNGSGAMCDALSTALFIMGRDKAAEFWRDNYELFDFVIITEENEILISEGLEGSFVPDDSGKFESRLVYRK